MLVELAIGDAYGAGFEYAPASLVVERNNLLDYIQHPKHAIRPGCYTDDTQMSLAIAEVIVAREPWTPEHLAHKFVQVFQRDPREGYAQGFYHFLHSVKSGKEFLERIRPESDKSGAAMRAAPIGVFKTIEEVCEKSRLQAALTHHTESGMNSAVAASLMMHYFLYRLGPQAQLGKFLEQHVAGPWSTPWQGKVGSAGWMNVQAAITALIASRKMSELLKRCVAFTGDVDTVATIALAAGSCSPEMEQDLPQHLIAGLENGDFGYDYLKQLDAQLLAQVT